MLPVQETIDFFCTKIVSFLHERNVFTHSVQEEYPLLLDKDRLSVYAMRIVVVYKKRTSKDLLLEKKTVLLLCEKTTFFAYNIDPRFARKKICSSTRKIRFAFTTTIFLVCESTTARAR